MPSIDLHAVRTQIPIQQVLDLLRFKPTARTGPRLRGPCPIHRSQPLSRSFSVHLHKGRYRCFKCHSAGSQLDLWMAVTGLGLSAAAKDLCQRLGYPVPRLPYDRP